MKKSKINNKNKMNDYQIVVKINNYLAMLNIAKVLNKKYFSQPLTRGVTRVVSYD